MGTNTYRRREYAFENEFNLLKESIHPSYNNYAESIEKIENYQKTICAHSPSVGGKICQKYNVAGINMYILPHYDMDEFFDEFAQTDKFTLSCYLFAMAESKFNELFSDHVFVANETKTEIVFEVRGFPHLHFINVRNMLQIHLLLKNPNYLENLKKKKYPAK